MSTPYNASYKVEQREAKASKRRVYPRWISCYIVSDGLSLTKIPVQGTFRCRAEQNRPRGKANVKAAKRAAHAIQKYMDKQVSMTASLIAEVDPDLVVTKRIYGAAQ